MSFLIHFIAVLAGAMAIGLGSAWHMISEGSALTTARFGPWSVWRSAGDPAADPYTKAHLAREGSLPITAASALFYLARVDSDGDPLVSTCEYAVDGGPLNSAWWSLAVYDASTGRLIRNKAERHAFNSRDMVRRIDGGYRIVLARRARPGNWLPTGDNMELQLALRVFAPRGAAGRIDASAVSRQLPDIIKLGCD